MPPVIPDKVYFKIGETAEIVEVEPYVLRYWESEFPQIKPVRAASKQRMYRRQDLETFIEIKRLLYEEKFTIAGAKKRITSRTGKKSAIDPEDQREFFHYIKNTLTEIKKILKD
ncbi:MAG: MerR family transcriptional regulator [Deltaproteobacteria bacterium]|nr:MerR family transcriptional regulator [Deltaproteobacteria bacterium]MBW2052404.1 MerR family transcriptional regulator [Deltaproteobacteria bacterium]MBW2140127.1 MerR family transcriptional regulator [Deltaproteobacteria bacterium]MBW2322233.1 MerR family transcriptional regulator [Deltaproteobacteria bacterium]